MKSHEPFVLPESEYYTYHPSAVAAKVFLYPISLGIFYYQKGYHLRRNCFDSILLMYIRSGKCTFYLNGAAQDVLPDQFVLLDTFVPHEYEFQEDSTVYWMHIAGPLSRSYYELITQAHGNVLTSNESYSLSVQMKEILEQYKTGKTIQEAAISSTLTGLLHSFLTGPSQQENRFSRAAVIERSRSYISEHFASQLSLEELAGQAGLSPYHFTRVFSEETGMTPHQYLIAARISAAKMELRTPASPTVKEIAFKCGFNSESSFCSTFRKWEGMTPKEYRETAFVQ